MNMMGMVVFLHGVQITENPAINHSCFFFYVIEESTSRIPFKIIWGLVGALALAILVTIIVIFAKQIRRKRKENVNKVY